MALDDFLVQRSPMSLRLPQPVPPVPDDPARIARAAFPRGNPYLLLRDRLGPVFDDAGFADLYPRRGQPGYTPWRLALVTLLQLRRSELGSTGSICWPWTWPLSLPISGRAGVSWWRRLQPTRRACGHSRLHLFAGAVPPFTRPCREPTPLFQHRRRFA